MKKLFFLPTLIMYAFFAYSQAVYVDAVTTMSFPDNYSGSQTRYHSSIETNNPEGKDAFDYFNLLYQQDKVINATTLASSITTLDPIPMGDIDTQHKPQAKTWFHAGYWWCAIPPASGGTWVYRLDETKWTPVFQLDITGNRTDCWVAGDLVHILMLRSTGTNAIATLQYDPATNRYGTWNPRPFATNIVFPADVGTATLTVDDTGRMWVAADSHSEIFAWWSDPPYLVWSPAITIASGIAAEDICAITKLPGKVGVFWSNQNTGFFGFKTHNNSDSPTNWSPDEMPASQSAIADNPKMADDHMNLTLAIDGTLYCVAKTNYIGKGLPQLILLVRRPEGVWDNLYPVGEGTQAIVLFNEATSKVKVVYTSSTNGGDILYREAPACCIIFGPAATLIGGPGATFNFASSTHQTYKSEVAILATNMSIPRNIVSVLLSDSTSQIPLSGIEATAFPNPFLSQLTFCFTLPQTSTYSIKLYDSRGAFIYNVGEGTADATITKSVKLNGAVLAGGLYMIIIQTPNDKKILKLVKQ